MAIPSIVGVPAANTTPSSTFVVASGSVAIGQLVVGIFRVSNTWVGNADFTNKYVSGQHAIAYRVVDGTESWYNSGAGGNITFTATGLGNIQSGRLIVIADAPTDGTDPFDQAPVSGNTISGAAGPTLGPITTLDTNSLIIVTDIKTASRTYSSGWTGATDHTGAGEHHVLSKGQAAIDSTGAITLSFSGGGSAHYGTLFAIREGGIAWAQPASDSVSEADASTRAVGPLKADTASATDAAAKTAKPFKADTVAPADASSRSVTKPAADSVNESDASTRTIKPFKADAPTASDVAAKKTTTPRADSATVTDSPSKKPGKTPTDSVTASDVFSKQLLRIQPVSDTVTAADVVALNKGYKRGFAETATISEGFGKKISLSFEDELGADAPIVSNRRLFAVISD
jgi:hypothetical protein